MGRYIKDVQLNQPIDVVSMVMEDYIYHERFYRTDWNGEMVFYKQDANKQHRYMKWSYAGGLFHLEAWLKGPFDNEMDLDGVGGGATREEYRKSLEKLVAVLKHQSPEALSGGHVGADPLHHTDNHAQEHKRQAQGEQMSSDSAYRLGKILSILAIIMSVATLVTTILPLVFFPFLGLW